MALLLSSSGIVAVINSGAYVSFSPKQSLTCKRSKVVAGNQVNMPTSSASSVVATKPLTKEDLIAYFASGCKPKEMWRIGTEHEKFGFEVKTLRPIKYEQITALLNGIAERYGWDKVMEKERIIGLKQGMRSISLEPGGQLELSGAPLETLHQTCDEIRSHLHEVKTVAEELEIGFLGIGYEPKSSLEDVTIVPKGRFHFITDHLTRASTTGPDVFFRTCTVQVATAIFANSPFSNGKPNGFLSVRSHMYIDSDKKRTGMIPFVFDDSFGFERYVEYALDLPMLFLIRNESYLDCKGMTFRDFMSGKISHLSDEQPTINDWEIHLGTIYPEVRLKRYLEMRGADGGPLGMLCALPAFWVGLLYDEDSLQAVLDMIYDWTPEEREMLRTQVPITGLKTMFRDIPLRHVAEDLLKLAKDGLERRGYNETGFLNAVTEVVKTGVTPAEKLLKLYNGEWGQNIDHVFQGLRYS
ncbi:glutamate--cysteine ligase, chloroplastic isoform X3 [Arabidopsis lyrata subsp. lyrata]|uniref:glutamate--cysteine ligase, chloroplastic isoform X3 n=1 Tax=Arabidopsis lyrata subsp. lyrata TaxID=81972 RepID=UPI000A29AD9F|nr:glutamate--cysteine ligase, chloroplastic isoform X3 [Arabidopsis lyrata subsp. lyrata]|eukprot:XP_020873441.1 glutamate--cysteine ligase, chloroplastic isoform X3 [Arabidopsis lyrata subsp. lyrata]